MKLGFSLRHSYIFLLVLSMLLLITSTTTVGQKINKDEQELRRDGERFFKDGNFKESVRYYSQLLSLYPLDPVFNYRYAVSIFKTSRDKSSSYIYFENAQQKGCDELDLNYYMGITSMFQHKFNEAISFFEKFIQIAGGARAEKLKVNQKIQNCKNAIEVKKNQSDVVLINRNDVSQIGFYSGLDFSDANGKLLPAAEQFLSSLDKTKISNPLMFLTADGKTIIFGSYAKGSFGEKDLYRVEKSADGTWGTPINLGNAINTSANEDYAYLSVDGNTLYFASEGHNSIGGYDLFSSTYNANTGQWAKPINLNMPLNTVDDDIYLLPNQNGDMAKVVSAMDAESGMFAIKTMKVGNSSNGLSVIYGQYNSQDQPFRRDAKISVIRAKDNGLVTTVKTDPRTGTYEIALPPGETYLIVVEAGGYLPHVEQFILPDGIKSSNLRQSVMLNRTADTEELTVANYFTVDDRVGNKDSTIQVSDIPSQIIASKFDLALADQQNLKPIQIKGTTIYAVPPKEELIAQKNKSAPNSDLTTGIEPQRDEVKIGGDKNNKFDEDKTARSNYENTSIANEVDTKYPENLSNKEVVNIALNDFKQLVFEEEQLTIEAAARKEASQEADSSATEQLKQARELILLGPENKDKAQELFKQSKEQKELSDKLLSESLELENKASIKHQEANQSAAEVNLLLVDLKLKPEDPKLTAALESRLTNSSGSEGNLTSNHIQSTEVNSKELEITTDTGSSNIDKDETNLLDERNSNSASANEPNNKKTETINASKEVASANNSSNAINDNNLPNAESNIDASKNLSYGVANTDSSISRVIEVDAGQQANKQEIKPLLEQAVSNNSFPNGDQPAEVKHNKLLNTDEAAPTANEDDIKNATLDKGNKIKSTHDDTFKNADTRGVASVKIGEKPSPNQENESANQAFAKTENNPAQVFFEEKLSAALLTVNETVRDDAKQYVLLQKESERLEIESLLLEDRIEQLQPSPARDSLIKEANQKNIASVKAWQESQQKLRSAEKKDQAVMEKMSEAIAVNLNSSNQVPSHEVPVLDMEVLANPITASTKGIDTTTVEYQTFLTQEITLNEKKTGTIAVFSKASQLMQLSEKFKVEEIALREKAAATNDSLQKSQWMLQADGKKNTSDSLLFEAQMEMETAKALNEEIKIIEATQENYLTEMNTQVAKQSPQAISTAYQDAKPSSKLIQGNDSMASTSTSSKQNAENTLATNTHSSSQVINSDSSTQQSADSIYGSIATSTDSNLTSEDLVLKQITSKTIGGLDPNFNPLTISEQSSTIDQKFNDNPADTILSESQLAVKNNLSLPTEAFNRGVTQPTIEMDPSLPSGLIFKVQIGAFRKPLPPASYKNITPLSAESSRPGWVRYCVGLFRTFEPANLVKLDMRATGFKDAFVVAYYNGKRISLNEAAKLLNLNNLAVRQAYVTVQSVETAALAKIDITAAKYPTTGDDVDANQFSKTTTIIQTNSDNSLAKSASKKIGVNEVGKFTIQVGVYKKAQPPAIISGLNNLMSIKTSNGFYKFYSGVFETKQSAAVTKSLIATSGIADAFVTTLPSNALLISDQSIAEGEDPTVSYSKVIAKSVPESGTPLLASGNISEDKSINASVPTGNDSLIVFRIQVGAYRENIPFTAVEPLLKISTKGIMQKTDSRGLHIFYAGTYTTLIQAQQAQIEIKDAGIKDAFIVGFKGNERITVEEALRRLE